MAAQSSDNVAQSAFVCQLCDQKKVDWKCEDCDIFICSPCKVKIHPRIKSSDKHRIMSVKDVWMDSKPWYHGLMTYEKAESLLKQYKHMGNGTFLVRESAKHIGKYSLDVLENDKPKHIAIYTKDESGHLEYFSEENFVFDSLTDFINSLKNRPRITTRSLVQFTLSEPVPKEPMCDK